MAFLLLLAAPAVLAADAVAGAKLYREARWTSAIVKGALEGGPQLPRRGLACAGCHGREPGLAGTGEGGLAIPPLSWSRLGRRGLATPSSLVNALTTGGLPDGSTLGRAMPRFTLPEAAAADLLAYLEDPQSLDAPGVTADAVRLGILVPAPLRGRIEPLLAAWANALAENGGLWGRRVTLVALSGDRHELARQLVHAPVLAVLASGPTAAQEALLAERDVIELAPLAPLGGRPGRDGMIVALGPGLVEMAAALGREILARRPGPRAQGVPLLPPQEPEALGPILAAVRPFLAVVPTSPEDLQRHPDRFAAAGAALLFARPPAASLAHLRPDTLLAGPIDILADLAGEPGRGGTWLLSDSRADTLPDTAGARALVRHLEAATRLAETGLLRAGRRLTRGSLLAALAAAPVDLGGPVPLTLAAADRERSLPVAILEAVPATGQLTRVPPPPTRP
jgi:mono/diheme cytochrome c family protein